MITKKSRRKSIEIIGFEELIKLAKSKQIISKDNFKKLDILNKFRNEIVHNMPITINDLSGNLGFYVEIVDIFEYMLSKISSDIKIAKLSISSDIHKISPSNGWFSKKLKFYLKDFETNIKRYEFTKIIEKNVKTLSSEGTFTIAEASKEISKSIPNFKTYKCTHFWKVAGIFKPNYEHVKYSEIPNIEVIDGYAVIFKKQRVLTTKFINLVVNICKEEKDWERKIKNFYDKKMTIKPEEILKKMIKMD